MSCLFVQSPRHIPTFQLRARHLNRFRTENPQSCNTMLCSGLLLYLAFAPMVGNPYVGIHEFITRAASTRVFKECLLLYSATLFYLVLDCPFTSYTPHSNTPLFSLSLTLNNYAYHFCCTSCPPLLRSTCSREHCRTVHWRSFL